MQDERKGELQERQRAKMNGIPCPVSRPLKPRTRAAGDNSLPRCYATPVLCAPVPVAMRLQYSLYFLEKLSHHISDLFIVTSAWNVEWILYMLPAVFCFPLSCRLNKPYGDNVGENFSKAKAVSLHCQC